MAKSRLLISDENQLFREGIRRVLESRAIEVVAEVSSLGEAHAILTSPGQNVSLIVSSIPTKCTPQFEAMSQIRLEFPDIPIIVLTHQISLHLIQLAVKSGANGFLSKDISADALRLSIELVVSDERIFPAVRSILGPWLPSAEVFTPALESASPRSTPLSPREKQILEYLAKGLPNTAIAQYLNITDSTVKVHLKTLFRKLNLKNRTQMAIWTMNNLPRPAGGLEATPPIIDAGDSGSHSGLVGKLGLFNGSRN